MEGAGGWAESIAQRVWQRVVQDSWRRGRWLSCMSLQRGIGQEAGKDPEPAATDIQSACAPYDSLGSPVGLGPTPLLSMSLHGPWPPPAARTQTQSLISVHSVGGGEWQAHRTCTRVLRARPVVETSTEEHLLLPYPPAAQNTGKEKAHKMTTGHW